MIIEKMDGTRIDIADYKLKRLFNRIPSAEVDHESVSVDGRSDIIVNTKINNRVISVEFLYNVYDIYDYYSLRDQMNDLFVTQESFYIIFKREPYKRWKVKLNSQFQIEPNPNMNVFTVNFLTVEKYSESNFLTSDFIKDWDSGQHGWNGTIDWDGEKPEYVFNSNSFTVKNLGNEKVDPAVSFLEIEIKGNFPNGFSLFNARNSKNYDYYGPLTSEDTLEIKGIRTLKNGVSDFRRTNKKLIDLLPGDNDIVVYGGTVESIKFNFRYLYK